jgi:hypothetical protein
MIAMLSSAYDRLILVSILSLGAIAWGTATALFAPKRWPAQLAIASISAALSGVGLCLITLEYWPLALGIGLLVPIGFAQVRNQLTHLLRPRIIGVCAVVLAVVCLTHECWRYDQISEDESFSEPMLGSSEQPPNTTPSNILATTDRGATILLHDPIDPRSASEANQHDQHSVAVNYLQGHWIRRGPADDQSNCHGWVFAAGRFNLNGRWVKPILADNGYLIQTEPHSGDVCVYTDSTDTITHTGVVRSILDDGTVLVESKWGRLGVYLHPVGESCYGTHFEYYRSERVGHTLTGIPVVPAISTQSLLP